MTSRDRAKPPSPAAPPTDRRRPLAGIAGDFAIVLAAFLSGAIIAGLMYWFRHRSA